MTFVCFVPQDAYEQVMKAQAEGGRVAYGTEALHDAGITHRLIHIGSTNLALAPTLDLPGYDLWHSYREADVVRALAQHPVTV